MKKVLVAVDGLHFPESALQFAMQLNELSPVFITGLFLPQISYANVWSYADGMGSPVFVPTLGESETETIEKNIERFSTKCQHNQIDFRIRKDFSELALPEIKKESRFADLMIIGSNSFYENMGTGDPNNYLKEALHNSECPILVVPDHAEFPTHNILAYDGSDESVFAIKQFIYLFPEWLSNETTLLYISNKDEKEIPKEPYIEDLASRHFSQLTITRLEMDAHKYFSTWIADKKSSLMISGSFSRGTISSLFKKSFVMDVLKEHKVPVFIAHK